MRSYETNQFEVTFNGDLISVDVTWDTLTKYIIAKYKPSHHYESAGETFFTMNMMNIDIDEFCENMDEFNNIVDISDEDLITKINSLLAIASTAVRKTIYDQLGQTKRDVPDAKPVERSDVQEKQPDLPKSGSSKRIDNSLF